MYLALCPDGAEGASYAMLSAFSDMAKTGASNIGIIMAGIWYLFSALSLFLVVINRTLMIGMCQIAP
jgi:hypothetical protein